MKTTELGFLLQVLPVRIIAFVETLGSHLKWRVKSRKSEINLTRNICFYLEILLGDPS